MNNKRVSKIIKKYGLEFCSVENIDIRTCYPQYRPNSPVNMFFNDSQKMDCSPHFELAKFYFEKGRKWVKKNYSKTKYYYMKKYLKSPVSIDRFCDLCDSLREGYLSDRKKDRIIILLEPFAKTRYLHNIAGRSPEIWSGHHRAGICIALGQYILSVIVAKDNNPGSKKCISKIHEACK